jgi:hypothetical protein
VALGAARHPRHFDDAPLADWLPAWDDRWMNPRSGSYARYSVGCAVVWAVILGVVAARDKEKFRTILPVFGGWWMGWTSATIARDVYPPPKAAPRSDVRGHAT